MSLNLKQSLAIGTVAFSLLPCSGFAGETAGRSMVWAHNTPWFRPEDYPLYTQGFYNFPLQPAPETGHKMEDSLAEEVKIALNHGVDGFFLDFGGDPGKGPAHWSHLLPFYLKAAEGTPFQVGICMDTKISKDYWVRELKRLLKANGDHPNYPRYNGKYVVCAYQFLQWENQQPGGWTIEEWKQLRAELKEAGIELYIVANAAPLPNEKLDLDRLTRALDAYDCVFLFDAPGHADETPEVNNEKLADFCRKNGKRFMACLHPGYYGAWLWGFNDFYNPFRGFDMFYRMFASARKHKAQWTHLTTWNDLVETAVLPRVFTFGLAHTLKTYSSYLKNSPQPSETPDVLAAYLRELLPGEVLRLELHSLPSQVKSPLTLSGKLYDLSGKAVWTLPPRSVSADQFARAEWVVPTAELAASPVLIPEFTVTAKDYSRTVRTPAVYLVTPWLQNAVTVNVPLAQMLEDFPNTLAVGWNQGILEASVDFDAPEEIRSILLFRNDRPIATFSPELKDGEIQLVSALSDVPRAITVTVENGRILRAVKKGQQNNSVWQNEVLFRWTPDKLETANANFGPHGVTFAGSEDMKIIVTNAKGEKSEFSPVEIANRRRVSNADALFAAEPEMTWLLDSPLAAKKGKKTIRLFAQPPRETDNFFVRIETASGKVHFSAPIYPFAKENRIEPRKILGTLNTLESTSGGSGYAFRNEPEFLTPAPKLPYRKNLLLTRPVSALSVRSGIWHFDGAVNGMETDRYGDRDLAITPEFYVDGGFDGKGKALSFNGERSFLFPARIWPLSGFGTMSFYLKPEKNGVKQSVIFKDGWYDGLSVNLLEDGRVEILRTYLPDLTEQNRLTFQRLTGKTGLKPGEWAKIEIKGDAEKLSLYVNGKLDGTIRQGVFRSHGNGRVSIGGREHLGYIPYRGLFDELVIRGW